MKSSKHMKRDDAIATSVIEFLTDYTKKSDLDDIEVHINVKKGLATISGHKNGIRATTTISIEQSQDQTTKADDDRALTKRILTDTVKRLHSDGFTQKEIARIMGISQSSVSIYLRQG